MSKMALNNTVVTKGILSKIMDIPMLQNAPATIIVSINRMVI